MFSFLCRHVQLIKSNIRLRKMNNLKRRIWIISILVHIIIFFYIIHINLEMTNYFPDVDFRSIKDTFKVFTYSYLYKNFTQLRIPKPINPTIYKAVITPDWDTKCLSSNVVNLSEIVIFIKSAVYHFELRKMLRKTWANPDCFSPYGTKVHIIFTVCKPNESHSEIQNQVIKESETYRDLLQFDSIENYYNITYKILGTLNYAVRYFGCAGFVLLIDDDFLVHPLNLVQLLKNVSSKQYATYIGGDKFTYTRPHRSIYSKWYLNYSSYPFLIYPPYPGGGTVILSKPMVKILDLSLRYFRMFPFDDVLLGIVAHILRLRVTDIPGIKTRGKILRPIKNLISSHGYGNAQSLYFQWNYWDLKKLCH